MSFSRLTPRSARTGIVSGRRSRQKPGESSTHLRLWEAIRRTREEIDSWRRRMEQVDGLFQHFIVPREQRLTSEYCTVTGLLINHFELAGLSAADQSLLGLWITENLQALSDHPFAPKQRRQSLNEAWRLILSVDGAIENQLARLASGAYAATPIQNETIIQPATNLDTESNNEVRRQDKDSQTSNCGDSTSNTNSRSQRHEADEDGAEKHGRNRSGDADRSSESNEEKISILEQRLSVERLFRQLAKVLHPDREQDESLKAQKHILMSQCLKARQEKDINTLLSLYCEHVGDLPDDITDNSHEELISALKQQLKQLQLELRHMRFADPLHTQIVERYSSLNDADCEHRIKGHAASLDIEIENTVVLTGQLDSQPGLMDALEQRREVELDRLAIDELTGMS